VEVELVDSEVSLAIVDEDTGDFVVVDNSVFHSDDVLLLEDDESLVFWLDIRTLIHSAVSFFLVQLMKNPFTTLHT